MEYVLLMRDERSGGGAPPMQLRIGVSDLDRIPLRWHVSRAQRAAAASGDPAHGTQR